MLYRSRNAAGTKMNILTREGIPVSQLPPGGLSVTPDSSAAPESQSTQSITNRSLKDFLCEALTEGIPFVDGIAPKSGSQSTWKAKSSPTTYRESAAPVYASSKTISITKSRAEGKKQRTETWFSRRSCHKNSAEKGTASWQEFVKAFYERHADTEHAYVPTVIGVRRAIWWKTEGIEVEVDGEKWIGITCEVWEMKHRIDPKLLSNRVFPTLQIAARLDGKDEVIFLQAPVAGFAESPYAEYARDKSLVVASYTAVERLRILPISKEIEWIMATASDAGGNLPQFIQNLAVTGEIAKDVKMYLEWISSQRS